MDMRGEESKSERGQRAEDYALVCSGQLGKCIPVMLVLEKHLLAILGCQDQCH